MNLFRRIFKKKVKLPLWLFLFSTPKSPEDKEFQRTVDRIVEVLLEDKSAIILIDNQPHKIYKDKGFFGKVHIEKIEDWTIE